MLIEKKKSATPSVFTPQTQKLIPLFQFIANDVKSIINRSNVLNRS